MDRVFSVGHMPSDEETARQLAKKDPWSFQLWVNGKLGAAQGRRGGDGGEDGRLILKGFHDRKSRIGIVQVKGSQNGAQPGDVDRLRTTIKDKAAQVGVLVAFSFSEGVKDKASREGTYKTGDPNDERQFPKILLVTVQELLNRGQDTLNGKVPSYIERQDYTYAPANIKRREESAFNMMMDLPDQASPVSMFSSSPPSIGK